MNDPNKRLLLPVKSNISQDTGGLSFRIEEIEVVPGIQAPRLVWDDEPVEMNFDDAMLSTGSVDTDTRQKPIEMFLKEMLANGPRLASDVFQEGAAKVTRRERYAGQRRSWK